MSTTPANSEDYRLALLLAFIVGIRVEPPITPENVVQAALKFRAEINEMAISAAVSVPFCIRVLVTETNPRSTE